MTREDIIRMAREAGLCIDGGVAFSPNHNGADVDVDDLQTFAALVAAADREACAEIADGYADNIGPVEYDCGASIAAAIRARGCNE